MWNHGNTAQPCHQCIFWSTLEKCLYCTYLEFILPCYVKPVSQCSHKARSPGGHAPAEIPCPCILNVTHHQSKANIPFHIIHCVAQMEFVGKMLAHIFSIHSYTLFIFVVAFISTYLSQVTALSSAECRCRSPSSANLVKEHLSWQCYLQFVQISSALTYSCPDRFSMDHSCQGRSKLGGRIVGFETKVIKWLGLQFSLQGKSYTVSALYNYNATVLALSPLPSQVQSPGIVHQSLPRVAPAYLADDCWMWAGAPFRQVSVTFTR